MAKLKWTVGSVGSSGFLLDFELYIEVLGVGRCPVGLVAPSRIKTLDFHAERSNMGPVSADLHHLFIFRKSKYGSVAGYMLCF